MGKWDPDSYLRFEQERTQPSYDLVSRIVGLDPATVIDIGCGPGNSTRVLRERWPNAWIAGLDNSPEMIEKARQAYPQGAWILADAATWQGGGGCNHPEGRTRPQRYDLVFSNAALQWVPDHERMLCSLFGLLEPRGALAVQVPANNHSPLYRAVARVSRRVEWRDWTAGCEELLTYHPAGFYYDQLTALSRQVYVWQTTYYHVMADHGGMLDWYASTGMRCHLERLPGDAERKAFRAQVLEECRADYPQQRDGQILFPFRRLFFVAYNDGRTRVL